MPPIQMWRMPLTHSLIPLNARHTQEQELKVEAAPTPSAASVSKDVTPLKDSAKSLSSKETEKLREKAALYSMGRFGPEPDEDEGDFSEEEWSEDEDEVPPRPPVQSRAAARERVKRLAFVFGEKTDGEFSGG